MRMSRGCLKLALQAAAVLGAVTAVAAEPQKIDYADQGPQWTAELRAAYYTVDQGARTIPLAWLEALRQSDGKPFLDDAMARYGYLKPDKGGEHGLPIGFSVADSPQGPSVGVTCAACHVRDITFDHKTYRIDGAPAFIDFGAFLVDLDDAVHRVLASKPSFAAFSAGVLGPAMAENPGAVAKLKTEVEIWWVRFHTWISLSLPKDHPWGPARLDAMGMIFNRIAGLDIGSAPTYLIPENISRADAPVRYPFLWNSPRQDFTQWAAFDPNGNDVLAMIRNLGQVYGVFAEFHPQPVVGGISPLNRNYLVDNSANFVGLGAAENFLKAMGPPKWPWPVDQALAKRGEAVFQRECAQCHGVEEGMPRPPAAHTWKTRIVDAGTDTRQWQVLMHQAGTGSLQGAALQGGAPLKARDGALDILKVAVIGTIFDVKAVEQFKQQQMPGAKQPAPPAPQKPPESQQKSEAKPQPPPVNVYEAKVLQGVWAAAPYLHNGSVPTLADLLEPQERRPKTFQVGPAYDPQTIGLARAQGAKAFTLKTTGCDDRASGDSNCGHTYGTALPAEEKRALLEYLKTL